jgi:hypothetical protein
LRYAGGVRLYVVQPGDTSAAAIAARDEMAGCPRCGAALVKRNPQRPSVLRDNGYLDFRDPLVPGDRLALPEEWFDGRLDAKDRSYFDALPDPTGLGALPQGATMQPIVLRPVRVGLGDATSATTTLGTLLAKLPSYWPWLGLAAGGVMALTGVALMAGGKRAASNPTEPCGEYLTRSGKVGAKIKRSRWDDGRISYSYIGEWGAGSGLNEKDMRAEVQSWLERKRGIQIVTPFCGARS